MNNGLSKLSAPARRALASIGVQHLEDLAKFTEQEILARHGMGPDALNVLQVALREEGLSF